MPDSDLREQHEVRLEQGLDAFVVVDGLPVVPEASKPKLVTFLIKKLNSAGKVKEDGFFMPVNEKGMTEGYASYRSILLQIMSSCAQICLCRISNATTG